MIATVYIIIIGLIVILPLSLASGLRRFYRKATWGLFAAGVLTFVISQAVHLPLNNLLDRLGLIAKNDILNSGIPLIQTAAIMGLTAGLCEELARVLLYGVLRKARSASQGIMLGLGHGGIEAMIVGGVLLAANVSSYLALQGADLSDMGLSAEQLGSLQIQLEMFVRSPWYALPPFLERVGSLILQVGFSVMVLMAFQRKNALFVLGAILYHAAVDAVLVFVAYRTNSPVFITGTLIALLVPMIYFLYRNWPQPEIEPENRQGFRREVFLFITATRKEILRFWRSKQLVVILAVFVVFGLMSPLLAYFMPTLIGSVEGARQFAELIPTPTYEDAISQYIKNITQFGFILVLLIGMGSVAGEKEKGTAAMILSKPMPRWVFIVSKFTTQALVYFVAFVLAGLCAYLYIGILFRPIPAGSFFLANLFLFLWIMAFIAATLLGSSIGKTVGAGAGYGLAGCILILLAGSIPKIAGIMPNALVSLAELTAKGDSTLTNSAGGAITASIVVSLLCIVISLAFFENEEL